MNTQQTCGYFNRVVIDFNPLVQYADYYLNEMIDKEIEKQLVVE